MYQQGQVSASAQAPSTGVPLASDLPEGMRLHIGGKVRVAEWTVLDILPAPHVDIIGDCADLSRLDDGSCAVIYASHVVEHLGYNDALPKALAGFHRVLAPGGLLMVAVPDMETLCRLFLAPELKPDERFFVMRMLFGGRIDAYDVHLVGFNAEILGFYLTHAGFIDLRRVPNFGLFNDASAMLYKGVPVSLNVVGRKPPAGAA